MTRVIGILAGGGSLPREVAQSILNSGNRVVIVAIEGECDPVEFKDLEVIFVKWGQVGRIIRIFKEKKIKDIIIIGSVRRPNLWKFRTDFGFYKNLFLLLTLIKAGGDDGVLRSVIRVIERRGFCVLGPKDIAQELIITDGPVGEFKIPPTAREDIQLGFRLIKRLAPYDIGQSVVVKEGHVIGIEAAEGTDQMLERVKDLPKKIAQNGILVKGLKTGQELRIDMPTIGPNTVDNAVIAGLCGIVVQSGVTLAAQRSLLTRRANLAGIFVSGHSPEPEYPATKKSSHFYKQKTDSDIAVDVLRILKKDIQSQGVIVIRRHILALETGEGISKLLQRSAKLQQWGGWKFRKRGSLAVSETIKLSFDYIDLAARMGLADVIQLSPHNELSDELKLLKKRAKDIGISLSVRGLN